MSARILVVDDEPGVRAALTQVLEYEGYEVRAVASGTEALTTYASWAPRLVLLDVKMAGIDGLETLSRLRAADPEAVVVMISGHATLRDAVDATQRGAYDILEKPLDTDRILVTIRNAIGHLTLREENARLRAHVERHGAIVGASPPIRALVAQIDRVAATGARVLITGENGTGKELVARAIHAKSPRASAPFIEVNCAAIPGELIESELFGHMRGSFTGAVQDRPGKFELADRGTLFLDEIGDMSLAAQAKVLRVLEDGAVTRIGGRTSRTVDVRVLAATNKRLEEEIAAGRFREDLYYRLNVVPLTVPTLRERREDIPMLVTHFVERMAAEAGMTPRPFDAMAMERLVALDWPGNVRELRNTIERLLILSVGAHVTVADIDRLVAGRAAEVGGGLGPIGGARTWEEFKRTAERTFLLHHLRRHDWNIAETARALEMPRSNLYAKLERHRISRDH
ncbi:MAG: sigma-54 dependent transcriptional regulator [Gemmatimonadota bacterium]|nr:sigma-54 dependent transcriptional regulator [Gemmatimonadota bacterium]MDQ8150708.1 sigma-54 dependent transcriptional regulator [Gemmatimonadota bacterium]MDQ8170350.1 sigma-54 dependent transcriptional regulator [Gemmatimonadota bacterium]MDQ8177958.1 sigma-54 dependent transcriptional regulator [Gemmatimonadota bacterium]